MPAPTIETERLILREIREEDLDGWASLLGDPESARFIGGGVPRAVAWRAMAAMAGAWELRGCSMFSVVEKSTGKWIGRLGPWHPEGWPGTEVGWGLVRDAWGKGYATEGSAAAMDWAVEALGWEDIIHCIDPANAGSIAVAKRLGSSLRGPGQLPAPFDNFPIEIWGQSRDEWARNRRSPGLRP